MPSKKKLCDVADIITGIPEEKYGHQNSDLKYYYIQPNNLTEDGKIQDATYIWKKEKIQHNHLVKNGDVLIKRLNHSHAVLISDISNPTVISPNLFIIRPFGDVLPEYLACLFERAGVLTQIEHLSGTSVSIKTISAKKLMNIKILIIPMREQKTLGQIWLLSKQKRRLLQSYIQENENLLSALVKKLTTTK